MADYYETLATDYDWLFDDDALSSPHPTPGQTKAVPAAWHAAAA